MTDWKQIGERIGTATGERFSPLTSDAVGGGCINAAARLSDGHRHFFVKLNRAERLEMFEAEQAGLDEIGATNTIRVPRPVCTGLAGGQSFIVLEHLELRGSGNSALAGDRLAALHRHTSGQFGWHRDNTIGSTPQPNGVLRDWATFWRVHRLGFQLDLAARNGLGRKIANRGALLLSLFPALLDHAPAPSLLHGDLWGGNLAYSIDGDPVIFDPATYYGDREAEIAMTELFGRLPSDFYAAYNEAWPLDPGYPSRKRLYNLYHILNHANMFGGGYVGQAAGMIEALLADLGH